MTPGKRYAPLLLCALIACDAGEVDVPAQAPPPDTAAPAADTAASVAEAGLIRADGIAHARRGMTIGDLRAALPADANVGDPIPFMVDIDALPIVQRGDTMYHVLIPAGEPSDDAAALNVVATTNTALRTAEGIGPGSTLEEAAAAYGAPTLFYSINDESREYAEMPGLPESIRLRVVPASDTSSNAGVYETAREYNTTTRYDPAARVMMVLVSLR